MSGRVVLVTGGTNGIGKATAERFAKEGDTVIAWGTNEQGSKNYKDISKLKKLM